MRLLRNLSLLCLMMLSCVVLASAQAEVKEQLPNGNLLITYQGKNYVAMPPEAARKLNDNLDELDRLRVAMPLALKEISQLRTALDTAQKLSASSLTIATTAQSQ